MSDLRSFLQGVDCDSGGGTDLVLAVNLRLSANGGSIEALGQKTMASSIPVTFASDQSALAIDTEMPTAASLADATANPTTPLLGAAQEIFNGTTWDRRRSVTNGQDTSGTGIAAAGILGQLDDTSTGTVTENQFAPVRISSRRALLIEGVASGTNMNVNLAASAATVTVDSEMPTAAALADAVANPTTTSVGAYMLGYNGTTFDRLRSTTANGLAVDVTRVTGTITVDTELPTAAVLSDSFSNPTAPAVGAFGMGWTGSVWERVKTVSGRYQVDVISGGGGGATNPSNPVISYQTSASLAAGSSIALTTAEATSKKLRQVVAWSSAAYKVTVHTVDNAIESAVKFVGGGQPFQPFILNLPHQNYLTLGNTAGLDAFRCNIVNLDDANACDVYVTFCYED